MADIRVAWVNEGASMEDPWTLAQFQARDLVERAFAGRVATSFVEHVQQGSHAAETLGELSESGHDLVIATSAALAPTVLEVASAHPAVVFEQARGSTTTDNVSTFTGAHEQSAYLTGLAAGGVSPSGRIAYVAPVFELETLRILNGFARGVEVARPGSAVLVAWTDSWWDPIAERRAAELLVESGADVVATGCTGVATGQVAAELGLPWCGQDTDCSDRFGGVWVTAPRILPGGHYCRRVRDRLEGRWRSQAYVGDLADGFTDVAALGLRVPPEVRTRVMTARAEMIAGGEVPGLCFPVDPRPPERPAGDGRDGDWSARTHAANVVVLQEPPVEPTVPSASETWVADQ